MAQKAKQDNPSLDVISEPDREALLSKIGSYVKEGDTILVKASHFMHFEELVNKLQKV